MDSPISDLLSREFQDLSLVKNSNHHSSSSNTAKSQKINETTQVQPMPPWTPWTPEEKMAMLIKTHQCHKEEFMKNEGFQRLHRHKKHRNCHKAQLLKGAKEVLFKFESKYATHKRLSHATKHLPPRQGNDQTRERWDHRPNPDMKTWWARNDKEWELIYGEKYSVHGSLAQAMKNCSKKMDTHLASAGILSKFEDLSL